MIQTRVFFGFFTGQWIVRSLGGKNRENLLLFSICVTLEWENAEKLCEKLAKCHVRINENINKAINQARPNRIRKSHRNNKKYKYYNIAVYSGYFKTHQERLWVWAEGVCGRCPARVRKVSALCQIGILISH